MHHQYRNANTSSLWYGDIIDLYGRATSAIHPAAMGIVISSSYGVNVDNIAKKIL